MVITDNKQDPAVARRASHMAMADGIHIISIYLQGLHENLSKKEALRQSLTLNLQPVTLATVTTAMGFLSLNYCTSAGIYGFGNRVRVTT